MNVIIFYKKYIYLLTCIQIQLVTEWLSTAQL